MSQGVSMMKNDKDHTIEVTLDLNQDGIKLHSSGIKIETPYVI